MTQLDYSRLRANSFCNSQLVLIWNLMDVVKCIRAVYKKDFLKDLMVMPLTGPFPNDLLESLLERSMSFVKRYRENRG